jgi:DNA-binding PadR family transcriptional regulator
MAVKGKNLGEFEIIVLMALLRLGDTAYGISIKTEIEDKTGRDVSIGAIYTTLDRLHKKSLISAKIGEATAERGGRAKKYFRIEAEGERRVREAYTRLGNMAQGVLSRRASSQAVTKRGIHQGHPA